MPRAVITGCSLISPAGANADEAFRACLDKRCAGQESRLPAPLDRVPLARLPAWPETSLDGEWTEPTAVLALAAGRAALHDAGLEESHMRRERSAIVAATSKGGVLTALAEHSAAAWNIYGDGLSRPIDAAGGLWRQGTPACALTALCRALRPGGQVVSVVAACASGLAAVAAAARLIAAGETDTVLVVAADASIHPVFVGAFWRLGVLATWRTRPGDACRPFAKDRCGFVLSEGAAAVVLQADGVSRAGRRPQVTVASWAVGCQGDNLVRSHSSSNAQAWNLGVTLRRAGWTPDSLGMIHAHATGTIDGDRTEANAIAQTLGRTAVHVPVISTKPITGHMLGAAGLAQAVIALKALEAGLAPPMANHAGQSDPSCPVNCSSDAPARLASGRAICMASGFGGTIAAIALERTA